MATAKRSGAATRAEPRKTGRPSKFEKRFVEQAYNMALLGLTDPEMAQVLGTTRQTLLAWRKAHPEFADAVQRGKLIADANVTRALYDRATGYSHPEVVITSYQGEVTKTRVTRHYPPETQAIGMWLHNRQPTRWRKDPDPTSGADDAPPPVKVVVEVKDARTRPADADA